MDAIVALCHFCEAHGPRAIFCTYSESGTETVAAAVAPPQPCVACGSLGADTVLVSRAEHEMYCSREALPSAELSAMLRQAAIRSLTCEVSWSKDGGTVYFSESGACHVLSSTFQLRDSRARGLRRWFSCLVLMNIFMPLLVCCWQVSWSKDGGTVYFSESGACHVLSSTFQLRDSRARGLRRWFSCLVLMKDQVQLLNMMPFFSEHIKKSSVELQTLASAVFEEEQRVCSQRALRLNTGRNDFGPSRSLQQLTGDEGIFHALHARHAWMLRAGARTHAEALHTSGELLRRLAPAAAGERAPPDAPPDVRAPPARLRAAAAALGAAFRTALYCALTGVQVVVKTERPELADIEEALSSVVPDSGPPRPPPGVDPPTAPDRCILREAGSGYECAWPGTLPSKCPTLMTRIESAMSNARFNDGVLDQHVKCLQLEWLGTARTLKNAIHSAGASAEPVIKLKQVLGVAPHDEQLINYWMRAFCT